MESTKNLVQALVTGNADAIESSFNAAIAEKISARLDDMRIDVAKSMFTSPVFEESFDLTEEEMLIIASLTQEEIESLDEENKELVLEAKNWIAGAIKHPGALTRAAKRAGESTSEYEQEHKHDSGKAGKRARLALTLSKFTKEEVDHVEEGVMDWAKEKVHKFQQNRAINKYTKELDKKTKGKPHDAAAMDAAHKAAQDHGDKAAAMRYKRNGTTQTGDQSWHDSKKQFDRIKAKGMVK